MAEILVRKGQCLIDIALQTGGNLESLFDIAEANNLSITSSWLDPGTKLKVPDTNNQTVAYLFKNGYTIATIQDADRLTGIGYWIIGKTFKIG